jgi:hypothetical protein
MKQLGYALLALGSAVLAYLAFAVWCTESHPVPRHKLARLQPGMHVAEVERILGRPYKVYDDKADGFRWIYGSGYQWYYVYVEFSPSSNVVTFGEKD